MCFAFIIADGGIYEEANFSNLKLHDAWIRPFIRMKINLNTSLPLASGFYMPCEGSKPRWIAYQYEHLDEYCSSCGLIGHIQKFCSAPPEKRTPEKYKFCLRAAPYVRPCLMPQPQPDDSDSGVSSVASVGNSPSCLSPSRHLDPTCSSFSQLVSRNQMDSHGSSNNLLNLHHVASSGSLVPSQPNQLYQSCASFSPQNPFSRYPPKGTANLISLKSHDFNWPYPPLRDPHQITPTPTHLSPCSSSRSLPMTFPLDIFPAGAYPSRLSHTPGLFDSFLHKWAHTPKNPSLFDNSPSPFQLVSPAPTSSPSLVEPIPNNHLDNHINRKLPTHKLSRFRPYDLSRSPTAGSASSVPTKHIPSLHLVESQSSLQTSAPSSLAETYSSFPHFSSPSPANTQPSSPSFEIPAIISRGKGKSKLVLEEDDLPLVSLKKFKFEQPVSAGSISNTSEIESAALSLSKLHGDPFFKGPVHKFLTSPILDDHGKVVVSMPPYGGGYDLCAMDSKSGRDLSKGFPSKEPLPPSVCGAYTLLQGSHTFQSTSMVESDPMDIHQSTIAPAAVAVSHGPVMRRFVRASRGRRMLTSPADLNQHAEISAAVDILEDGPQRSPPQL
jgi:hypothetical protein